MALCDATVAGMAVWHLVHKLIHKFAHLDEPYLNVLLPPLGFMNLDNDVIIILLTCNRHNIAVQSKSQTLLFQSALV